MGPKCPRLAPFIPYKLPIMKRAVLVVTAALILGTPARAEDFADVPGLSDSLTGIRAQTLALRESKISAIRIPFFGGASPDVRAYPVRGVDVSHLQPGIDWLQVKKAGISFAYIKATEGEDFVDPDFARNWRGAAAAGVARGAYQFYNFCKGGAEQADRFIQTVPPDPGALPPVIDLEQSRSCAKMPARAAFQKDLAEFVRRIKAAYGRAPMLYVNYAIYDDYIKGGSVLYRLWITDAVHKAPQISDNAPWTMWQYGYRGKVPGIPGVVDVDVFNGSSQQLAALARTSGSLIAGWPPLFPAQF